jgi:hypothetical protein
MIIIRGVGWLFADTTPLHNREVMKMAKLKNLNALKHGVYSHLKLLPEESCEEFEQLHRDVYAEFDPQGPVQESKADSIAPEPVAKGPVGEVVWRNEYQNCRKRTEANR